MQIFNRTITFVENSLLALALFIMIALASTQIIMRNFWDSGLAWGDISLSILVLWVAMLGAMVATREQNHISIDLLSRFLSPRTKGMNQALLDLFTALVCGLLSYHSARFVMMEYEDGTVAFESVPAWLCEVIIPFGFGLIALRCSVTFMAQCVALVRKSSHS
ncbi:MAG: TRAP transporter small permease subunit [Gammaproteobacteria bacterium]|nr:TRAP transporter small permease subunit [Gammaproteobacteria bacterium]